MAQCDICGSKAVYFDSVSKVKLCGPHFSAWYEKGVASAIEKYHMICPGDKIAVGLSGGKDSTVLLTVLAKMNPDAEFIPITVDEGIAEYRDDTILAATRLCEKLGLADKLISFTDICGKTLDELLEKSPEQACSVCGTLRRRALNLAAREAGADKIATGHCLDDEAQSVLMNYLRGDVTRVMESFQTDSDKLFLPRIKPLCRQTERATVAYGLVNHLLTDLPECPYTRYALRAGVRSGLGILEYRKPGTMINIVSGQEKLLAKLGPREGAVTRMGRCEVCGEPTSHRLCAACALLEKLN
ncbi:MAG TPA: TIGR00269 family protein [Methanocorpusculum sp.]|nr:TIGR00269 family protein [Methanocorpusculum sp.]